MLYMVFPQLIFGAVHFCGAVTFVICFINDHKAVLVTELIEHGCVGIVGGTDRIEIVFLNHLQIPLQMLQRDHRAGDGVGIMAVDTTELNGVAV